jgi:hypothetical protein
MTGRGLIAIPMILLGGWMFFFVGHFAARKERLYQARLADRLARGTDAHFEELRELQAYPPRRYSRPAQMLVGALLMLVGAAQIAMSVTG